MSKLWTTQGCRKLGEHRESTAVIIVTMVTGDKCVDKCMYPQAVPIVVGLTLLHPETKRLTLLQGMVPYEMSANASQSLETNMIMILDTNMITQYWIPI